MSRIHEQERSHPGLCFVYSRLQLVILKNRPEFGPVLGASCSETGLKL
jgi:hypothetical protein